MELLCAVSAGLTGQVHLAGTWESVFLSGPLLTRGHLRHRSSNAKCQVMNMQIPPNVITRALVVFRDLLGAARMPPSGCEPSAGWRRCYQQQIRPVWGLWNGFTLTSMKNLRLTKSSCQKRPTRPMKPHLLFPETANPVQAKVLEPEILFQIATSRDNIQKHRQVWTHLQNNIY